MSLSTRRDRREKKRREARTHRPGVSGGGGRPSWTRFLLPAFVVFGAIALMLGLRAAGVFEVGPRKLDPNEARFNPAGFVSGVQQKDEGRGHATSDKKVSYGTIPPTSGDHWDSPAPWGSYDKQQPDERIVHNLEHGGIVISYAPGIMPPELEQLKTMVSELRTTQYRKILLQPYPSLPDAKIALTSWSWLMKLQSVDQTQIVQFVRAHYDGPEAPEPGVP